MVSESIFSWVEDKHRRLLRLIAGCHTKLLIFFLTFFVFISTCAQAGVLTIDAGGKDVTVTPGGISVSSEPPVAYADVARVIVNNALTLVVEGDTEANEVILSGSGGYDGGSFTLDSGPVVSFEAQSFAFFGNGGVDILVIDETLGPLPRFTGRAVGAHSSGAFEASGRIPADPNIGINFVGNGDSALTFRLEGSHDSAYFPDNATANPKSGIVNVDGVFTLSFEGLAPIAVTEGGLSLTLIVDGLPALNALEIDDDVNAVGPLAQVPVANDGISAIFDPTGTGGLETIQFAGFANVTVISGDGPETITVVGIDYDGTLTDLFLDSENLGGTDPSDDTFVVVPHSNVTIHVDGGAHTTGDTLTVDAQGALAVDTGAAVLVTGFQPVNYTGIESVNIINFVSPEPDIKANGEDGPLTISKAAEDLVITISLDPGGYGGTYADWWVRALRQSNGDTWWYVHGTGWVKSVTPVRAYGGKLRSIAPMEIWNGALPVDTWIFHFAVDTNMNNILDSAPLYWDKVKVTVNP